MQDDTSRASGAAPAAGAAAGIPTTRPRVAVVLEAGAARGWSHIGVLEALDDMGVKPDVVVGCSSGSVVAGAYCAGRLEPLKGFASSLTWRGMLGYFDFSWRGGGLIEGRWLVDFLEDNIGDPRIEALPVRYGSVATELATGRETWFTSGSLLDAMRASIALPGLMTPIAIDGRWMVDGALANPIPVSLSRALGAEVILGVSMSGDLVSLGRSPLALRAVADDRSAPADDFSRRKDDAAKSVGGPLAGPLVDDAEQAAEPPDPAAAAKVLRASAASAAAQRSSWLAWLTGYGGGSWSSYWAGESAAAHGHGPGGLTPPSGRPGYFDVIGQSFFSMQNFVSRVRLAADPVDVLIVPDVEGIGVMDFHRGAEAIEAGYAAVEAKREAIKSLCGVAPAATIAGSHPSALSAPSPQGREPKSQPKSRPTPKPKQGGDS